MRLSTGKLFWKFFIFFFVAQFISVLIVSALVWSHNQEKTQHQQIENTPPSRTLVQAMAVILRYGGTKAASETLQDWLHSHPTHQVYVVDQQRTELLGRKINDEVWKAVLSAASDNPAVKKIVVDNHWVYYVFVPEWHGFRPDALARMEMIDMRPPPVERPIGALPPPHINRPLNGELFPLIPLLIGVLSSLISASILAWNFSKPIKTLGQAFTEVAQGHLETTVADRMGYRHDELSDLGMRFDQMVRQLKALIEGQTRLLHHISHEMRTPLTRLQIAIDLFKQNPEKLNSSLDRLELEISRMDKLMSDVLDFSRLDAGIKKIRKEAISIGEMMHEVIADAAYEAEIKGINVHYSGDNDAEINASAELLHRAIENLVRNSIKYSPADAEIEVTAKKTHDQQLEITVSDHGLGVPADELNRIFEPFYRASNTAKKEGYGLGLTLTKQIIEAHEGKINAANNPHGGLCISIILPLKT